MQTGSAFPPRVELLTARPENLILVENCEDGVVIRAAEDNFSSHNKSALVRYLALEGFIPEHSSVPSWVVDSDWLIRSASYQRKRERRLLSAIIASVLVWLGLMVFAFLHAPR